MCVMRETGRGPSVLISTSTTIRTHPNPKHSQHDPQPLVKSPPKPQCTTIQTPRPHSHTYSTYFFCLSVCAPSALEFNTPTKKFRVCGTMNNKPQNTAKAGCGCGTHEYSYLNTPRAARLLASLFSFVARWLGVTR